MRAKKKSFLSILLSLALVIGMMPMLGLSQPANAETTEYNLSVDGIQVTSANMNDVLANDPVNGGKVSYTPATTGDDPTPATLTLKDANITTDQSYHVIEYTGNDPLTIEPAEGTENTLNITNGSFSGIHSENKGDVIIDGKGILNIRTKSRGIESGGNITINNGTLDISATGDEAASDSIIGIYAYGDITIKGGTVNAVANAAASGRKASGITSDLSDKGITIEGGNVNVSGTGNEGYGFDIDQKPVSVNGGTVVATGTRQAIYRGLKNSVEGLGWTDVEGTQGQEIIPVSDTQKVIRGYKKVQFPRNAEKVTVKFDSAGGSAVASQTIEKGTKATKPADPNKSGYTFDGWYNASKAFDFNTAVNDNITLTAHWKDEKGGTDPDAKAKSVKTVTVNVKTVNAKAIDKEVKKAGGSSKYVTTFTFGKKVKKISKGAFKKYKKVKTLVVKTKKLKKSKVKGSLKGSKITKIKVKVGNKKMNKKYVKKYKKIFTKKNAGKKVKVV